eukprot:scaffold25298_cov39-Tisochrysis_lutea.AAC.1
MRRWLEEDILALRILLRKRATQPLHQAECCRACATSDLADTKGLVGPEARTVPAPHRSPDCLSVIRLEDLDRSEPRAACLPILLGERAAIVALVVHAGEVEWVSEFAHHRFAKVARAPVAY